MAVKQVRLSSVKTVRKYNSVSAGLVVDSFSGGSVTTYDSYTVHSFLSSGTFTYTKTGVTERNPGGVSAATIDYLVVGGGGSGGAGGGNQHGGGGSGGYGQQFLAQSLSTGSYPVTVGGSGQASSFNGYTGSAGGAGPYMGGWAHSGATNGPNSSIRTGVAVQYGVGAGGYQYDFGASGTANTGNGGQRGTNTGSPGPGSGGSGIVVIRRLTNS